jgi:hypothetical protein
MLFLVWILACALFEIKSFESWSRIYANKMIAQIEYDIRFWSRSDLCLKDSRAVDRSW